MTKKSWIIFTVIVVATLGTIIFFSSSNKINVSNIDENKIIAPNSQNGQIGDNVYGNRESKVILIEYGDYQCPGCASSHPQIKNVVEKYKSKIAFIFRQYPLTSIHPNAKAAAGAVEAAGLSNKFWEMHDLVYENQSLWENANTTERTEFFSSLSTSLGIDKKEFQKNLEDSRINEKINFDLALGKKANITGTPTFYINGDKIEKSFKDNKIVSEETEGAQPVWSDAIQFEEHVIKPYLEKNNIDYSDIK